MADLNAKQIEQIAKIRKESKIAKSYIFADCICTGAIEGCAIGAGASLAEKCINENAAAKKMKVINDSSLTSEEKEEKLKKIDRGTKFKKGLSVVAAIGLSSAGGWIKGSAAGVSIKHEDELAKKRIAAVIASAAKKDKK